jgi:excisionase family DNA binding protein
MNKIAYGITRVCELTDIGRTTIYSSISSGALRARKVGRRTILLHDDVVAFLEARRPWRCRGTGAAACRRHSIALHDAAITFEKAFAVDHAATGRVAKGDGRRIGRGPRDDIADPERQNGRLDVDTTGGRHLGLPIERQVPSVFSNLYGGYHRFQRQARPLSAVRALPACSTAFSRVRQAYLRRRMTSTRNCAGITSSRCEVSSPITCMGIRQKEKWCRQARSCRGATFPGAGGRPDRVSLVIVGLCSGSGLLDVLKH